MSMNVQSARTAPDGATTTESKMQVNVGKGIELDIDHTTLPPNALQHAIMIGLRNILMDSHASITSDEYLDVTAREEAARAMVDKKLAALMSGEVRVRSTREGDPIRAEAMRMATAQIHAIIKKGEKKVADYKSSDIRAKAAERITPELLAMAKARVAELRAATPDDTSLTDLGL